jgi:hypothetical protein
MLPLKQKACNGLMRRRRNARQTSKPSAPGPVAKSGRVAESGATGATVVCAVKIYDPVKQPDQSTALTEPAISFCCHVI